MVVRRGQIRVIGWAIKTLEAQIGQFLLGYKCPVSRGIVVQEQDPLGDLPAAFFLQNVLQIKTTASNVPIVAIDVTTSLSLTGNRDWVLCIAYEVFI